MSPQSGKVSFKDTLAVSGGAVAQTQTVPLPSLHSDHSSVFSTKDLMTPAG